MKSIWPIWFVVLLLIIAALLVWNTNAPPKVTVGGNEIKASAPADLNRLLDLLNEGGFSNIVLHTEKGGHLYEVALKGRTNASVVYVGEREQ